MSTPVAAIDPSSYVPYSDSVEVKHPDEDQVLNDLALTMRGISETLNDHSRHAGRSVHAKSHALVKGELKIYDSLPEPLRQGLFAQARTYPVLMRFSTNSGDILPDSISTPRGLAIKVIGIEGAEMVPEHAGATTQDFLGVDGLTFGAPDAAAFLKQVKVLAQHITDSQGLKQFVSTTARLTENVIEAFGGQSGALRGFGHPQNNPLGETYGIQTPIRYGNYIAKVCIAPLSPNLTALTGKSIEVGSNFSALRDAMVGFFNTEIAVWEIRVQLCTNLATMPVEDASVEWPEKESPYLPVASITVNAQNAYSPERRVYFDELLSFNPWHALAAHRPLGNIMRARQKAYLMSTKYRHAANGHLLTEPKSASEIPD